MKENKIPTFKQIFTNIVVWAITLYTFNQTYKEMKKECYEIEKAYKRMWGLIILGLFLFSFIVILIYSLG
ncbi:hypothetical protein GF336_07810 [Candidatus Woesearchaeota archaeon]|nr:hypothetical protein [Candidatus Woesearchaeota archaeon]